MFPWTNTNLCAAQWSKLKTQLLALHLRSRCLWYTLIGHWGCLLPHLCLFACVAALNAPLISSTSCLAFEDWFPRFALTIRIYHEEVPHKYVQYWKLGGAGANNVIIHMQILLRWQNVSALFARVWLFQPLVRSWIIKHIHTHKNTHIDTQNHVWWQLGQTVAYIVSVTGRIERDQSRRKRCWDNNKERSGCGGTSARLMTRLERVPRLAFALKNILMTTSLQRQAGRVRPARVDGRNRRAAQQPAGLLLRSAEHREPFRCWGAREPSYPVPSPFFTYYSVIRAKLRETWRFVLGCSRTQWRWWQPPSPWWRLSPKPHEWKDLISNGLRSYAASQQPTEVRE